MYSRLTHLVLVSANLALMACGYGEQTCGHVSPVALSPSTPCLVVSAGDLNMSGAWCDENYLPLVIQNNCSEALTLSNPEWNDAITTPEVSVPDSVSPNITIQPGASGAVTEQGCASWNYCLVSGGTWTFDVPVTLGSADITISFTATK